VTRMVDTLTNIALIPEPVPTGAPVLRVALVGCGKTKLAHPARARDLYTGNLFVATRGHVEAAGYDAWYVLSARYGLVSPDQIIEPYEATMDSKTVDQLTAWVSKVDVAFRCINPGYGKWTGKGGRLIVDFYAGGAYADPLTATWRGSSWEINTPLAGLQMGERLRLAEGPAGSSMTDLTIAHTAEDGTTLAGDPRPHQVILKDAGWRFGRDGWRVPHSRDRVLSPHVVRGLHDLAARLQDLGGFTVDVEVDNTPRTAQERYDDAEDRADDRRTGLAAAAARRTAGAEAAWKRSDELTDGRPPGQPILVGHHSEKSDRARLDRSAAAMHRSMALSREATLLKDRAAAVSQHSNDSLSTILHRIEKLRGEAAALNRYEPYEDKPDGDKLWQDWHRNQRTLKVDDLALWEQVRDLRVAAGAVLWCPEHFEKKDRVRASWGWGTVERVNKKSLTVRADVMPQVTNTLSYTKVAGRARPGEEATANA
jgi:hypothetical protein